MPGAIPLDSTVPEIPPYSRDGSPPNYAFTSGNSGN